MGTGATCSLEQVDNTTYPREAVDWLTGAGPRSVLEIGAGDGSLTALLLEAGHEVHVTDPSADAVAALAERHPGVRTSVATAERLPNADQSVDVVVCTSFAQFTADASLAEFARVLKPGGYLALASNTYDTKIPWVKKWSRILGDTPAVEVPQELVTSQQFGFVDDSTFRHWQTVDADALCRIAAADPRVFSLDPDRRERVFADIRALYADYGRGPDGMQLPTVSHCFRAGVVENAWSLPPLEAGALDDTPAPVVEPVAPAGPEAPIGGATERRDEDGITFSFD